MAINPVPKTKSIDRNRNKLFTIKALANARARKELRFSDSIFSFEKTINASPEIRSNKIRSSAKLVRKVVNIFVSRNEENTANTGSVNLKSNQR